MLTILKCFKCFKGIFKIYSAYKIEVENLHAYNSMNYMFFKSSIRT